MKNLTLVLFIFFVSSLLVAQEKGNVKSTTAVKSPAAKNIDATKGAIKQNNNITVVNYDFTTGSDKYYGGAAAAVEVETGVWAMIAGDADQNGGIGSSDLISTRADLGTTNYNNNDVDMNGGVGSSDLIVVRKNLGKTSQLP